MKLIFQQQTCNSNGGTRHEADREKRQPRYLHDAYQPVGSPKYPRHDAENHADRSKQK